MTQQRQDPYQRTSIPAQFISWGLRLIFFAIVIVCMAIAALLLRDRWLDARDGTSITIDRGAEGLGTLERTYLQAYLTTRQDVLAQPAGLGATPQRFTVEPGQSAGQITNNLISSGLLLPDNETLFLNYLRFYGLDAALEAGIFELTPRLTVPELAVSLTQATDLDIELRFLEGWRVEEMAAYLEEIQPANIDSAEFLALARREQPSIADSFDYLNGAPTLEGFLFPDTYRIPTDADAAFLVDLMLNTFDQRMTPTLRAALEQRGLTLFDAVILASIVQREAVLPDEQPIIGGVFLNRVTQGIRLDADPTVQYALGYNAAQETWWTNPLSVLDLATDSPYNTYIYTDLPPGPIAAPGLTAIEGVAYPAVTDYLFFVANCNGPAGSHLFSTSYEEHVVNVQACR